MMKRFKAKLLELANERNHLLLLVLEIENLRLDVSYWRVNDGSGTAENAGKRRLKGRQMRRSSQLHQFSELRKEKEMQGGSTRVHLDLTRRQDNDNWVV